MPYTGLPNFGFSCYICRFFVVVVVVVVVAVAVVANFASRVFAELIG